MASAIFCALCMMFIDGVIQPPYAVKSAIKLLVFGSFVLPYALKNRENYFKIKKKGLLLTVLLSAGVYLLIVGGYFATRSFIDYSGITKSLTADIGVNRDNFLFVSLYISFVNSLLEEVFFRGYCYLSLRKHLHPGLSLIFSAALFALYHGGMLVGWFHPAVYALMLFLLFLAGLFLHALDHKADSILPSWLPHMFANFGINTVGFLLFAMS